MFKLLSLLLVIVCFATYTNVNVSTYNIFFTEDDLLNTYTCIYIVYFSTNMFSFFLIRAETNAQIRFDQSTFSQVLYIENTS